MPALHRPRRGCAPIVWPEESPQCRPQAHTPIPLARRLPEGGAVGNEGKRVSSGYNRRRRLATRSSGKQQAERTAVRTAPIVCPEESPLLATIGDNVAVINSPWWGLTRRLRREWMGLPPRRGIVLSFDAKESTKESVRHGDYGKKASIAHFGGGARYVARSGVGRPTFTFVRARSSPFSAVKMGGPFSLRCLSPLCSGAVGVGQAYPLRVGMLRCSLDIFAARMNGLIFLSGAVGGGQAYPLRVGMLRCSLGIFATQKASVKPKSRWPF